MKSPPKQLSDSMNQIDSCPNHTTIHCQQRPTTQSQPHHSNHINHSSKTYAAFPPLRPHHMLTQRLVDISLVSPTIFTRVLSKPRTNCFTGDGIGGYSTHFEGFTI